MPMSPYILVLAQTSHEASRYVRRAKLPRGRWRIVARAGSIANIRQAEVHCLPGFHLRPDKHSIMAKLRYAEVDWKDVEMPPAPIVDQGDGMGEQLSLDDLEPVAYDGQGAPVYAHQIAEDELAQLQAIPWMLDEHTLEVAYRYNRLLDRWKHEAHLDSILEPEGWEPPETLNAEQVLRLAAGESGAAVAPMEGRESPKAKRRRTCKDCGALHFKDEPCPRTDGVEERPVANPATMFD